MSLLLSEVFSTGPQLPWKSCNKGCSFCISPRLSSDTSRSTPQLRRVWSTFLYFHVSACAAVFRSHMLYCKTPSAWWPFLQVGKWGYWAWLRDKTCEFVFHRYRSLLNRKWGPVSGNQHWCTSYWCDDRTHREGQVLRYQTQKTSIRVQWFQWFLLAL